MSKKTVAQMTDAEVLERAEKIRLASVAEQARADRIAREKAVGQCYKYDNGIDDDGERFFQYAIVVGPGRHWPLTIGFQSRRHDGGEIISVEREESILLRPGSVSGYQRITRAEFDRALTAMKRRVASINPPRSPSGKPASRKSS